MKSAIAIIVVLSATALLAAARGSVGYNLEEYLNKIADSLEKTTALTSVKATEYMKSLKSIATGDDRKAAGKLALAAELMSAVGSDRQLAMLESFQALKGQDYASEMQSLINSQYKADSQINGKLESLIRLADEIEGSSIYKDVEEVVLAINEHRNYLSKLRTQVPK